MGGNRVRRLLLDWGELAMERQGHGHAGLALVAHISPDAVALQQTLDLIERTSRQGQMGGEVLGAVDHPRFVARPQTHRLGPVELGIGERCQAPQPADECRRKIDRGDEHPVSNDHLNRSGQRSGDPRLDSSPGRRQVPGAIGLLIGFEPRGVDPQNRPGAGGLAHNAFAIRSREPAYRGQVSPLVGEGLEVAIQEDGVVLPPGQPLQWQRDQVAESALGHRVLAGEQPVVGGETYLVAVVDRLGQHGAPEVARDRGGHRAVEEDPDVAASSRSRPFHGGGHAECVAGAPDGGDVVLPRRLVEVDSK